MKVKLTSEAPGSHGDLELEVTEAEEAFLQKLVEQWNDFNWAHAAPVWALERVA